MMPRSERGDAAANELFASDEPLLELPSISNLPRKPKMNSGDRACLFVFCMVGLSMCFVGPAVMFTDTNRAVALPALANPNDTNKWDKHESLLKLTWHAWQDRLDSPRPSMKAPQITDFPPFPSFLYTFYSHEMRPVRPNPSLSLLSASADPVVLVIQAGEAQVVSTVRAGASTLKAQLNVSDTKPSILVLATRSDEAVSSVQLDDVPLVNWTCMPGLAGEQSLVFQPNHLHSVNWTTATDNLGPFTWFYSTFHASGLQASRVLRVRANGLVAGYVYLNGVLLGRYNGTFERRFAVDVLEDNTIAMVEEVSARSIHAVEIHLE
ncbi:hypothetical protein H310_01431 [Aphanomyces invadans]|uniref:Beta-galactosidase n=1 Tax=Aphanomyces invadans TaxID=157072 RepID=A0A024URA6_9STRA|nr:hypothetical protein H310_01431 [Aphanomyces invadans]ETW08951.1 hypothetical protein H310_01431 [Aphanomyces invadans]|eukprot:XP_008862756.1 hypothetical protein H310_01431 [Aphanomyces invadans]